MERIKVGNRNKVWRFESVLGFFLNHVRGIGKRKKHINLKTSLKTELRSIPFPYKTKCNM